MDVREYLANAEAAFANNQYETALDWYQKVLELDPDNIYVLSRAGSICVPLERFPEALGYFKRVVELDPQNGDAYYNYGNACFFNKDNVSAFSSFVRAAKYGCSESTLPKLYYQMALLCSMRQDVDSALIYFRKCEEADLTGQISLNPDLISEKLKLYTYQQDYEKAAETAAQLVAIAPGYFRGYMAYFSLLMAQNSYEEAEALLKDCQDFAVMESDEKAALAIQYATLYLSKGNADAEQRDELLAKAADTLERQLAEPDMSAEAVQNLQLTLADILQKMGEYDKAIRLMQTLLTGKMPAVQEQTEGEPLPDLTEAELDEMLCTDFYKALDLVDAGVLDPNLGAYAAKDYDDFGNEIPVYNGDEFDVMGNLPQPPAEEVEAAEPAPAPEVPEEVREKAYFILLNCCLEKDDFDACMKLAELLKHCDNQYYCYYGYYVTAFMERKLQGDCEQVQQIYAEALAFFRSKCFADPSDSMAVVFRARLYAEQGSYAKAEELANLLTGLDQTAILSYIETCKKDSSV